MRSTSGETLCSRAKACSNSGKSPPQQHPSVQHPCSCAAARNTAWQAIALMQKVCLFGRPTELSLQGHTPLCRISDQGGGIAKGDLDKVWR